MRRIASTATAAIASSAHTATSLNLALHHHPRLYQKWLRSKSPIVRQNNIRLMSSSNEAPDDMKRLVLIGGGHAHVQGSHFTLPLLQNSV